MDYHDLCKQARKAKANAYAPYSKFRVGAALLSDSGRVFPGNNVENSSYSLTVCAERVAVFTAVAEGERHFRAIAIASDDSGFTPPCGACRQVLFEMAGDIDVIMSNSKGEIEIVRLRSLLPEPFTPKHLRRSRKQRA